MSLRDRMNTEADKIELHLVQVEKPEELNLILGQSHFIKTVGDLHEALAGAVPGLRFGIAFCESSGPRLVRRSGNDEDARRAGGAECAVDRRGPFLHRVSAPAADESVKGCGSISGSCLSRFPVLVAEVGGCEGVARRQGCRRNTVRMGLASAWGVESPRPGGGRCWQQGVLGLRLAQGVVDPRAKRRFWD